VLALGIRMCGLPLAALPLLYPFQWPLRDEAGAHFGLRVEFLLDDYQAAVGAGFVVRMWGVGLLGEGVVTMQLVAEVLVFYDF